MDNVNNNIGDNNNAEATEIRAEEKSKSGMKYEVILAQPQVDAPVNKKVSSSPPKISVEEIASKLKAAEERRQSIENQKLNQVSGHLNKIGEVFTKKNELNNNFVNQAKEQIENKMNNLNKNRETYISSVKAKLKEHDEKVCEVRKSLEMQKEELNKNIEKKLAIASDNREKEIQKLVEKLKEHEENVNKVRKFKEIKIQELETKIEKKLEVAQENREAVIQKKVEQIKDHDRHAEEVRQKKALSSSG